MQIQWCTSEVTVWGGVVVSVVAGMVLGAQWYGSLFGQRWAAAIMKDKGVPADQDFMEYAKDKWPYPFPVTLGVTLLCHAFKAYLTMVLLLTFDAANKDLSEVALLVAVCTAAFALPSAHHYFWEGRPATVILVDLSHDLVSTALMTSILLGAMRMSAGSSPEEVVAAEAAAADL